MVVEIYRPAGYRHSLGGRQSDHLAQTLDGAAAADWVGLVDAVSADYVVAAGYWLLSTRQVSAEWEAVANVLQWSLLLFVMAFIPRLIWVVVDWYNDTYEVSDNEVVNMRKLPFGLREDRRSAPLTAHPERRNAYSVANSLVV